MTWTAYLDAHQSRFIAELMDFIAIPSVSADPVHGADMTRAAEWVAGRLTAAGLDLAAFRPRNPRRKGLWPRCLG